MNTAVRVIVFHNISRQKVIEYTQSKRATLLREVFAALVLGPYGDGKEILELFNCGFSLRDGPDDLWVNRGEEEWTARYRRACQALATARSQTLSELQEKGTIAAKRIERMLRCPPLDDGIPLSASCETAVPCCEIALCPYCHARAVLMELDCLGVFAPASAGKEIMFFSSCVPLKARVRSDFLRSCRNAPLAYWATYSPARRLLVRTCLYPSYDPNILGAIRINAVAAPLADDCNQPPPAGMPARWNSATGGNLLSICRQLAVSFDYPSHVFFPHAGKPDLAAHWVRMASLLRNVNVLEVLDMAPENSERGASFARANI